MTAPRSVLDYLQDILYAIEKIEQFTAEMSYEQFAADEKTHFAVIRALEIMGEAAKQLPDDVKQRYPAVSWRSMMGMRDKMIHGYFSVILSVVWQTIEHDIPPLKPLLTTALAAEVKREQAT